MSCVRSTPHESAGGGEPSIEAPPAVILGEALSDAGGQSTLIVTVAIAPGGTLARVAGALQPLGKSDTVRLMVPVATLFMRKSPRGSVTVDTPPRCAVTLTCDRTPRASDRTI